MPGSAERAPRRCHRMASEPARVEVGMLRSWHTPEFVDFITEGVPSRPTFARKQIDKRAVGVHFDATIEFIRFAGMLAPRGKDQFADVLGAGAGNCRGGRAARFRIGRGW